MKNQVYTSYCLFVQLCSYKTTLFNRSIMFDTPSQENKGWINILPTYDTTVFTPLFNHTIISVNGEILCTFEEPRPKSLVCSRRRRITIGSLAFCASCLAVEYTPIILWRNIDQISSSGTAFMPIHLWRLQDPCLQFS